MKEVLKIYSHNVKEYILVLCKVSYLILALYTNAERHIRKIVSVAPPTVPSIIARWFFPWCFLLGIIINCGASIVGLEGTSSHEVAEKVRHEFPDILQIYQESNMHSTF